MFAIDEPPTGSKDPFALRRSAIGVLNILRARLKCGYEAIVDAALEGYLEQGLEFDKAAVAASVCAFIKGRMAQIARDEKVSADTVAAVSDGDVTVPVHFFELAHALEEARANDREAFTTSLPLTRALLTSPTRSSAPRSTASSWATPSLPLLDATDAASDEVASALDARDFKAVIAALAALRGPIDAFFDDVMVMDEDLAVRENRLRLLNRFESVFAGIANIGEMARK